MIVTVVGMKCWKHKRVLTFLYRRMHVAIPWWRAKYSSPYHTSIVALLFASKYTYLPSVSQQLWCVPSLRTFADYLRKVATQGHACDQTTGCITREFINCCCLTQGTDVDYKNNASMEYARPVQRVQYAIVIPTVWRVLALLTAPQVLQDIATPWVEVISWLGM